MIGVVIGMIPNTWYNIMTQAGTDLREMEFEQLITHLEILEETAPEHKDSEGNQEGKRAKVKMTRTEVVRVPKMDQSLMLKLEITAAITTKLQPL